jgi:SAM-dependent methyltransferase
MSHPNANDPGRIIDWGKTSDDYGTHRPGPPASFFARLAALGVGLAGQRILDLGTGTGALARPFARAGARVAGIDIAANQIATAKRLAEAQGLTVDFRVASAERTPFPDRSFDAITANQCWQYFDLKPALAEVCRLLAPGGVLSVSSFNFLPRHDAVVAASEALVLKHNPQWTGGDWAGQVPAMPGWAAKEKLALKGMFVYDEAIPFTRESWRGRMRACRGMGAALDPATVAAFDAEHEALLARLVPERFSVLHRISAYILAPE